MSSRDTDKSALRLLEKNPRVFWGKVVHVFIKQGWNPPTPDQRVVENITRAIEDITNYGFATKLNEKAQFTHKERAIIELVCDGFSNDEIAVALSIAQQTVKFHMSNIFNKTGARNRAHLVSIVLRGGYIDEAA